MKEYRHLMEDYLYVNRVIKHFGYHAITRNDLDTALHQLVPSDSPDMYAVLDDKIVIIEHFEFDASKCTKKGMAGMEEEALLLKRIDKSPVDNIFHIDKGDYEISLSDWQSNFNQCFDHHYMAINRYRENVLKRVNIALDKKIIVGFFIENLLSPYVVIDELTRELAYCETLQFKQKLMDSVDLDFVLFGCYDEGQPQIFYIDKEGISGVKALVDLNGRNIKISPMNYSEITCHAKFSFD